MLFTLLFATSDLTNSLDTSSKSETLVIKGKVRPCHIFIKATNLPETFDAIEKVVHQDLDCSLKFDTSFSSSPYLYKVELNFETVNSSECNVRVNIFDSATKELRHTCHLQAKTKKENWRTLSHTISDFIFEKIQGLKGPFSSKLAFIKRVNEGSIKSKLFICDYDGYNQKLLVVEENIMLGLNFSKDGRFLVYRTLHPRNGQRIWMYDLRNETRTDISTLLHKRLDRDLFGKNISALSFGGSHEELLFARSHNGSTTLHAYHMKTGQLSSLTQPQRYIIQTCPIKSADGNTLLFSADTYGREGIYCVKNGYYVRRLPVNETLDFSQPKLCENVRGKNRIFFSGRGKGFSSIWFVDSDQNGEGFEELNPIPIVTMQRPYFLENPCPTKNGEYVIYLQNKTVCMLDVKGNEITQSGSSIPLLTKLGSNVTGLAVY